MRERERERGRREEGRKKWRERQREMKGGRTRRIKEGSNDVREEEREKKEGREEWIVKKTTIKTQKEMRELTLPLPIVSLSQVLLLSWQQHTPSDYTAHLHHYSQLLNVHTAVE